MELTASQVEDQETPYICRHMNNPRPDEEDWYMARFISWKRLNDAVREGCATCNTILKAITCFFPEEISSSILFFPISPHENYLRIGECKAAPFLKDWHIYFYTPEPNQINYWYLPPMPAKLGNSDLETKFQRITSWLNDCQSSHSTCSCYAGSMDEESTPLPKRVLDVSSPDCQVRLHETQNETGRYICLSHRWGSPEPLSTTTDTLEAWKGNIPWKKLPKTFQDAIVLTRHLGIRYLWIDSLCIIQDDPEDWKAEAASMHTVYTDAFLTVFATRCQNSSDTLFPSFQRTVDGFDERGERHEVDIRLQCNHVQTDSKDSWRSEYSLLTRGWVFQERLLSRRIIHFGYDELMWECMESTTCECEKYTYGSSIKSISNRIPKEDDKESRQSIWYDLLKEYTRLALTKPSDRQAAILGLVGEIQTYRRGRYLAGLWEESLISDLAWDIDASNLPRPSQEATLAPTWSWASIMASCEYKYGWIDADTTVEHIQPPNPTLFPGDKRALGCITLKGKLRNGKSMGNPDSPNSNWINILLSGPSSNLKVGFTADCGGGSIPIGEPLYLLFLGYWFTAVQKFESGLVLRLVDKELQLHERIGLISVDTSGRSRGWRGPFFEKDEVTATVSVI